MLQLTEKDIKNISLIYFSKKEIKLFDNEKIRKKINGQWVTLKINMPDGAPDQIGWCANTGLFVGNEIKTINDSVSKTQKVFFNVMIKDKCRLFITKQINQDIIKITEWGTKEIEKIFIKDYMRYFRT